MPSWNATKVQVSHMMQTDPQRGTLAQRAMGEVEKGLQYLTSVGMNFEVVAKGQGESQGELGLGSVPKPDKVVSKFNSMVKGAPDNA